MNLRAFLEGTISNPIIIKELRATFRGQRFFVTFLGVLGLFTLILLGTIAVSAQPSSISSQIGQSVFLVFLGFVFLVSVFVFPAFSCTAIVSEREKKTYEMLLVTGIRPWEVVLGKFLACMCYVVTFITALLPLVFVSFLFGGVGLTELSIGVMFTLGISSGIVMASLFVSSLVSSARMAVMVTYGPLLFAATVGLCPCLCCSGTMVPAMISGMSGPAGMATVLLTLFGVWLPGLSRLETFLYLCVVPFSVWGLLVSWFFLLTTNRLRPAWSNRSTPLRIYYLVFLASGAVLGALVIAFAGSALTALSLGITLSWFWMILVVCLTLSLTFPTESPILSFRLREELEQLKDRWSLRRLMFPGPGTGFTVSWGGAAIAGAICLLFLSSSGSAAGVGPVGLAWAQAHALLPALGALFFLGALGVYLGTHDTSQTTRHATVFGTAAAMALLPFLVLLADPFRGGNWDAWYDAVSGFGYLLSAFDLQFVVPGASGGGALGSLLHLVGPASYVVLGMMLLSAARLRRGIVDRRMNEVRRRETTIIRRKRGPAARAGGMLPAAGEGSAGGEAPSASEPAPPSAS